MVPFGETLCGGESQGESLEGAARTRAWSQERRESRCLEEKAWGYGAILSREQLWECEECTGQLAWVGSAQ